MLHISYKLRLEQTIKLIIIAFPMNDPPFKYETYP